MLVPTGPTWFFSGFNPSFVPPAIASRSKSTIPRFVLSYRQPSLWTDSSPQTTFHPHLASPAQSLRRNSGHHGNHPPCTPDRLPLLTQLLRRFHPGEFDPPFRHVRWLMLDSCLLLVNKPWLASMLERRSGGKGTASSDDPETNQNTQV